MKRILSIVVIVGVLVIIVVKLTQNKTHAENRVFQYNKETPTKVFGEVITTANKAQSKSFNGLFESRNEVKLSADIQGKIKQILVTEGQKVSKGQVLLKLDDEMLQLKLNVLETKLEGLKKDKKRYETLAEEDAVPAIKLEKTKNAIATLTAEKKTILEQINKSTLKAPFSGVLSVQFCEVGGFASPAVPLFELINETDLKFVIQVSEENLSLFSNKHSYHVQTGLAHKTISVKLSQVSAKGGVGNNFKVEFYLNNSEGIKPKMNGVLRFETTETKATTVSIPSKSIIGSESHPEIYLVSNGKAVRTPISILTRNGNTLSVSGNIKQGDTVITGGFINLFDNANIKVNQ